MVDILAADGDTVVAVDLPGSGVVELARDLGSPHVGLECDVSREKDMLSLFGQVEAQMRESCSSPVAQKALARPSLAALPRTATPS
nr:hypothetical protein [Mesorhizobium japonicum]